MAWSKKTRITIMLCIDLVFFLVELVAGIVAHSLALQADAFHMLNDIISLAIGLWAVTVASKATTDKYSYGWLRAEIIGAFFNAVFLIALCISIILEAVTRFIDPPEITEPQLILTVGCFGLFSNLVGFFVLGGHGHDHGGGGMPDVERGGHGHHHDHHHDHDNLDELDRAELRVSGGIDAPEAQADPAATATTAARRIHFGADGQSDDRTAGSDSRSTPSRQSRSVSTRRRSSLRHSRLSPIDSISIYPASFRQDIIAASREEDGSLMDSEPDSPRGGSPAGATADGGHDGDGDGDSTEETPLLGGRAGANQTGPVGSLSRRRSDRDDDDDHRHHSQSRPKKSMAKSGKGHGHGHGSGHSHGHNHNHGHSHGGAGPGAGHGHSHADMGMNAMILHVIGDALGNVGVIVTALVVWLTTWRYKDYADPAVSLFITAIILRSALPLTMATAKILLQATPDHIDVSQIREDIETLDGVISCHHMHIWQLSDTKLVGSMHLQVDFAFSEQGGRRYMELALRVRECLHKHGVHSATIQPEFRLGIGAGLGGLGGGGGGAAGAVDAHGGEPDGPEAAAALEAAPAAVAAAALGSGPATATCILDECVQNCVGQGCCSTGTGSGSGSSRRGSHASLH